MAGRGLAGEEVDGGGEDLIDLGFGHGFAGEFESKAEDMAAQGFVDVELVAEGIHSLGKITGGFGE